MPDLPDSTPPVSPAVAALLHDPRETPPSGDDLAFQSYIWEEHPAFRFTFLMHFTQEGDRAAFEHVGNLLYDMALECSGKWPAWPESPTRAEMRTVAQDLRHAAAFLASVGDERSKVSLGPEDEGLSYMAATWAHMVERIARGIESVLPPIRRVQAP
jgi:hypothetical protein